jgi:hypothetical protein
MLANGLYLVADMAVRAVDDPLATRYRKALLLGTLREDVLYVPLLKVVSEYPSYSHFYQPGLPGGYYPFLWPGPRFCADRLFKKALADARAGRFAAAFVRVGRILHLITDMSIPSHAHRAAHLSDPFEWYVEGNVGKLAALPLPPIPRATRASELIEGLATFTQRFAPDRTNHPLGRLLRRLGVLEHVDARLAAAQARELVPMAAAYGAALIELFLREARAIPEERGGRERPAAPGSAPA